MSWLVASSIVILLWGIVGLLQKVGSNHSSSNSLLWWTTVGYLLLFPALLFHSHLFDLSTPSIALGLVSGLTNGLGAWCLYTALENGATASVAVPLTALNPLVTVILALAFLHEKLTPQQTVGVITTLAAAVMLSYESEPLETAMVKLESTGR